MSAIQTESLKLIEQFTGITAPHHQIEEKLKQHLLYLLEKDLATLYNLLYRIDVSEAKVRAIFGGDSHDIAQSLTILILERIQQKAEMRLRYKT
jgi:hypothetical protein